MNNNLRISHESLDMDDIISDLNPASQASTTNMPPQSLQNQQQNVVSEAELNSFRSQQVNNSGVDNLRNPEIMNGAKTKQAQMKSPKNAKYGNIKSSGYGVRANSGLKQTQNESQGAKNIQSLASMRGQHKKGTANNSKTKLVEQKEIQSMNMTLSTQHATNQMQSASDQSKPTLQNNFINQKQDIKNRYDLIKDEESSMSSQKPPQSSAFYVLENKPPQQIQMQPENLQTQFTAQQKMDDTLDSENFTAKLDQLILGFRTETMQEFIKTKGRLNQQKEQAIDAEKRRCNTLLGAKQNEIEQLKEQLAKKTKECEEYSLRCEIMALWSGKGQTIARMKVVQMKCFKALKDYRDFKMHSEFMLMHKAKTNRIKDLRRIFQAWHKNFKVAKVQRDKEKFDRTVKEELQSISATYQKEIENLRQKCLEAERNQNIQNRNRHMMQENLKKVFMRSVCALNFEAMSILDPAEQSQAAAKMESELEKQMQNAMMMQDAPNGMTMHSDPMAQYRTAESQLPPKSEVSFNLSEANDLQQNPDTHRERLAAERELLNMGLNAQNIQQPHVLDANERKIESKDQMWKPAPIMGREMSQPQVQAQQQVRPAAYGQEMQYGQPQMQQFQQQQPQQMSITQKLQQLRQQEQQMQQNYVLPSHFDHPSGMMDHFQQQNQDLKAQAQQQEQQQPSVMAEQQPAFSSTLPSNINMMASLPMVNGGTTQGEGKAIYAGGASNGIQGQQIGGAVRVTTTQMKTCQPRKK